jgi:hypothetical protein
LRGALQRRIARTSAREVAAGLELVVKDSDNPVRVLRAAEVACRGARDRERIYAYAGLDPRCAGGDVLLGSASEAECAELRQWQCGGVAVLDPGPEELAARIERRVRGMFAGGLVEEVRELRRLGYGQASVVARGIGYAEAGAVLDGVLGEDEAVARAITRTKQYAKRQRTYYRGQGWPVYDRAHLDDWAAQRGL